VANETEMTSLINDLLENGHEFSFVQVLRLARRFLDPAGEKGLPDVPWQDRVRVRPELSLAFPASDVAAVEKDGDDLRITTTFLALYGASSPLPTFYTEDLMDEASNDESVCRDFMDIIHQRLYHLYFECWSKYRLLIRVVEQNNPIDKERLLCLIGLGEKELASGMPDAFSLLRYTGILTQYPRCAMGLKTILRDALGIKGITIIQNIRRMVPIPDGQRLRMLVSGGRLGTDTVLGSKIADRMGKFRIRIGPLAWREFNDLLPGTARNDKLTSLTRFYLTDPLEVELELVLAAGEAQPIRIGNPEARLGLNTWDFAGSGIGQVSARFRLEALPNRKHLPSNPKTTPTNTGHYFVDYYRNERALLGELADRFAGNHPNLAPLAGGSMADPGVERLLEGTAFLNALLRRKLDDDIPEFINELITSVQPEHLRPVPAATIIAFTPREGLTRTQVIPTGSEVRSVPVEGTRCRFRTCYDVTVHPLSLLDASYSQPSGKTPRITLQLELNGMELSSWKAESLRLYLADDYPAACDLSLLLLRCLKRIRITAHDNGSTIEIPSDCLKPVGFAEEETVFTPEKSFMPGHLILQEYFLFRDKFLFLDLFGLERCSSLGDGSRFEITFELTERPLVIPRITNKSFALSATPVINLFKHKAKPISFVSELSRHVVRPAGKPPAHFRIYTVDQVRGLVKGRSAGIFYDLRNPLLKNAEEGRTCHVTQSPSAIGDGFDTVLSVEDENRTGRITLDIDLTCTNGTLPEQLSMGDICTATGATPESVEPGNIKAVSSAAFPKVQQNRQWRLLSGFSLNSLSLNSAEGFRAILRLFIHDSRNQAAVAANRKKIDAIESIDAQQADRLIGRRMYRGYEIRLKLHGEGFAGPGDLYLFCSVLERFLGGYVTQCCFLHLVVEETEKGYRFEWPARMGDRDVV